MKKTYYSIAVSALLLDQARSIRFIEGGPNQYTQGLATWTNENPIPYAVGPYGTPLSAPANQYDFSHWTRWNEATAPYAVAASNPTAIGNPYYPTPSPLYYSGVSNLNPYYVAPGY